MDFKVADARWEGGGRSTELEMEDLALDGLCVGHLGLDDHDRGAHAHNLVPADARPCER